jgi:hypothetical protein
MVEALFNKRWAYLKLLETRREDNKDSNLTTAIDDWIMVKDKVKSTKKSAQESTKQQRANIQQDREHCQLLMQGVTPRWYRYAPANINANKIAT